MTRRPLLILLGLVVLVGLTVVLNRPARPPRFDPSVRVTLYSIDGNQVRAATGPEIPPIGYPVLGKLEITDPDQKREFLAALEEGMAGKDTQQFKCFEPRHLVRTERNGRTTDIAICFHCGNYEVYVDGILSSGLTPSFDRRVRPVFDRLLAEANIPTAPE